MPIFRSATALSLHIVSYCPKLVTVGFMVDGMSVEQTFLQVCLGFPLLFTIPSPLPADIQTRQGSTVSLPQSRLSNYDVAIYVFLF